MTNDLIEITITVRSGFFERVDNPTNLTKIRKFLKQNYRRKDYKCYYAKVYGNSMWIDFNTNVNIQLFLLSFNENCIIRKLI